MCWLWLLSSFFGGYIALKKTFLQEFPELQGNPEIGKWYEVAPEGTVSAKGSPYQIYKMFSGFLHYLLIISLEMSDEPKKMYFGENIKSFHSAKLRFTFTHVYTCTSKLKD